MGVIENAMEKDPYFLEYIKKPEVFYRPDLKHLTSWKDFICERFKESPPDLVLRLKLLN